MIVEYILGFSGLGLSIVGGYWAISKIIIKHYVESQDEKYKGIVKRLDALEQRQQEYQDRMLTILGNMEKTLTRIETGELRFITTDACTINNRRIEDYVQKSLCDADKKAEAKISNIESHLVERIKELEDRLDKRLTKIENKIDNI